MLWNQAAFEEHARQEGLQQGLQEGEKTKAQTMARAMLADKEQVEKISKYTGLAVEEILNL